jgi:hypothetical protein
VQLSVYVRAAEGRAYDDDRATLHLVAYIPEHSVYLTADLGPRDLRSVFASDPCLFTLPCTAKRLQRAVMARLALVTDADVRACEAAAAAAPADSRRAAAAGAALAAASSGSSDVSSPSAFTQQLAADLKALTVKTKRGSSSSSAADDTVWRLAVLSDHQDIVVVGLTAEEEALLQLQGYSEEM